MQAFEVSDTSAIVQADLVQGFLLLKKENGQPQLIDLGPTSTTETTGGMAQGKYQVQGQLLLKTKDGQFQQVIVGPAPTQGIPGETQQTTDNIKEKIHKFFANLLELSWLRESDHVAANVQILIQQLIDVQIEPEVFCTRLDNLLKASTQPCLIGFLKKGLPLLRQSLVTKELVINGIRPPPVKIVSSTPVISMQQQATNNTKEKCRTFLANLLELSSREPKHVERNVRTLIQELIDNKVEPVEFCVRLEKLLNAFPQPYLIEFLRKSLPLLRQSLVTKELVIEGIRPPPANVFSIASATPLVAQQNQIRQTVAVVPAENASIPTQGVISSSKMAAKPTATKQVQVVAPMSRAANVQRPVVFSETAVIPADLQFNCN